MTLGPQFEDYRGRHQPPGRDYGAPMHDVEMMFPNFYERPELYKTYNDSDPESVRPIMSSRGNPDAAVQIHRAVPKGVDTINPGDWVTPSRGYAEFHREANVPDGHVISREVRAGDLFSEGNSIHEWGWHPEETS